MMIGTACRAIATAVLLAGLAGCSSATQPDAGAAGRAPVRLAIINPQTGDFSPLGKWEHKGVKLAVDEANATGGVNGHRIELAVFDDDGFDMQPGLELDLIHRRAVGRVGDPDEQPVAALIQRQRAPALQCFRLDELGRKMIGVERVQIDQREPERVRGELGDFAFIEFLRADQFLDERDAGLVGAHLYLFGVALGEQSLLDHRAPETG